MPTEETYVEILKQNNHKIPDTIDAIGYIPSNNTPASDIDVVFISSPTHQTKPGKTYTSMCDFLDLVDLELERKHNLITARATRMCTQQKVAYLVKTNSQQRPLNIHTLLFCDLASAITFYPASFLEKITHITQPVYGNIAHSFASLEKKLGNQEIEKFRIIHEMDTLQSIEHKPEEVVIGETTKLITYLHKHHNNPHQKIPTTKKECRTALHTCIQVIDR